MRKINIFFVSFIMLAALGCGSDSAVQIGLNPALSTCAFKLESITNGPIKSQSTTKWICNYNYQGVAFREAYFIYADGTGEVSTDGVTVATTFTWAQTACNEMELFSVSGEETVKVQNGSIASGIFNFESSKVGTVACQLNAQ